MPQNITVKLAGMKFNMSADTPEDEHIIREAAETVQQQFEVFQQKYSDQAVEDLFAMVALSQAIAVVSNAIRQKKIEDEVNEMSIGLGSYLSKI